jgi:tetratricopeptide (TPR) repeat protein
MRFNSDLAQPSLRAAPSFLTRLLGGLFLGALIALPWVSARPAAAEDAPLSAEEEERLEAIESHTAKGWKAYRSGNHEEVLARMKRVAKYDPASPLPGFLTSRVLERTGQYEKALAVATKAAAEHPEHRGQQSERSDEAQPVHGSEHRRIQDQGHETTECGCCGVHNFVCVPWWQHSLHGRAKDAIQ